MECDVDIRKDLDVDVVLSGGTVPQEIDRCVTMELVALAPSMMEIQMVTTACTRMPVTSLMATRTGTCARQRQLQTTCRPDSLMIPCSKVNRLSPMPQSLTQIRFRQAVEEQRTEEAEEASAARQAAATERSAAEIEAHKRVAERTAAEQLTVKTASKQQSAEVEKSTEDAQKAIEGQNAVRN